MGRYYKTAWFSANSALVEYIIEWKEVGSGKNHSVIIGYRNNGIVQFCIIGCR